VVYSAFWDTKCLQYALQL